MYDKERTRTGENSRWTIIIRTIFGRMATSMSIPFSAIYLTLVIIIITFTIGEVLLFSMKDLFVDQLEKPELKGTYFGAIGFSQLENVSPWAGGIGIGVFRPGRPSFIFSILAGITLIGLPFLAFAYRQLTAGTAQARPGLDKPL
ncbi:MAG: hypothetical protein ACQEWH_01335 [Bacillota bacterium]